MRFSHILQEMTVPSFVVNDAHLASGNRPSDTESSIVDPRSSSTEPGTDQTEGPNMLILTGPNYSGKSVYMKMVRLPIRGG